MSSVFCDLGILTSKQLIRFFEFQRFVKELILVGAPDLTERAFFPTSE